MRYRFHAQPGNPLLQFLTFIFRDIATFSGSFLHPGEQKAVNGIVEQLVGTLHPLGVPGGHYQQFRGGIAEDQLSTHAITDHFLDLRTDGPRIRGKVYRVQGDSPFTELFLELAPGSGTLCYTLGDARCRLPFGLDEVTPCRFPVYDMFCASSGMWLDEHTFYIRTHLLDTSVGSIHFQLYFGEDDVTVYMKKQEENLFEEYSGHLYGLLAPGQGSRV